MKVSYPNEFYPVNCTCQFSSCEGPTAFRTVIWFPGNKYHSLILFFKCVWWDVNKTVPLLCPRKAQDHLWPCRTPRNHTLVTSAWELSRRECAPFACITHWCRWCSEDRSKQQSIAAATSEPHQTLLGLVQVHHPLCLEYHSECLSFFFFFF